MLGGRGEVISAPAVELLKYMDMKIEEAENERMAKQAEMYIGYLSQIFSQQLQEKPSAEYARAKKDFEALITPDKKGDQKKQAPKQLEWDDEVIKQIEKERQEALTESE